MIKKTNSFLAKYLFLFSGFFLIGLSRSIVLNPVYITFLLCFLIFIAKISCTLLIPNIPATYWLYVFFVVFLIIYQSIFIGLRTNILNEIGRHLIPFLYYFLSSYIFNSIDKDKLNYFGKQFIRFNILILLIEMALRLVRSILAYGITTNFYNYKLFSILYPDSNFTGIHILVLFFFDLYWTNKNNLCIPFFNKILYFLLIILTFSRTAYAIYFMFYILLIAKKNRLFRYIVISILLLCIPLIVSLATIVFKDGSFKTKLEIFFSFIEIFAKNNLTKILFGFGSGNLINVIGRESHNFFGLAIEMGIVWFILILIALINLIKNNKQKMTDLYFIIFVSGFISLFPITYLTIFFSVIAYINVYEKNEVS